MNENNLITGFQSGFRPLYSTLPALIDASNKRYIKIDNELINAILFIDLKTAFDAINHEIWLKRMASDGFQENTINLSRNYLHGRTQITGVNSISS